jgi:hypothetical protein
MVAKSDMKFRITALIGKIKEPVKRKRSTIVDRMIQRAAQGSLDVIAFSASV